jgi:NAD(P)-dependent dehydrogenase (short-subunit alcohol dehydrogenase family)
MAVSCARTIIATIIIMNSEESRMKSYQNKVAVITGAASGIGRGLAEKAAALGMRVVLADIDRKGLQEVEQHLRAQGASVIAQYTDVSKYDSVIALADTAFNAFGAVNMLFNNAAILVDGLSWERSVEDWRWSLDVNVMGVIHGMKAFIPRMLKTQEECIVINTASNGGLLSGPFLAPYGASKHAVVTISESLYFELKSLNANVRAAVLCPGDVATNIWHSERIRPEGYGKKAEFSTGMESHSREVIEEMVAKGMSPQQLADIVFEQIDAGKFWIITHPEFLKPFLAMRISAIMEDKLPQLPDYL